MSGPVAAIMLITAALFPFLAMPLLWRRMKRVRAHAYDKAPPPKRETAWEEKLETRDGLNLVHTHETDDNLIGLGERSRHAPWPLSNQ
jgi:hypothetical protein